MDKLNFIMINAKIIGEKLNDFRIEELDNIVLENELVFNKELPGTVLLLKDLTSNFYIGVDSKKGLVRVKSNKKTQIKDISMVKTSIKGVDKKLKESLSKVYALFIDDPEIPTTVSNYKEYFKILEENIDNGNSQLINLSKLSNNARLSASISVKENGEEYGLGKYSSISFSSSISMDVNIEEIKDFQNFVFKYNNKAINFMKNKTRNNYNKEFKARQEEGKELLSTELKNDKMESTVIEKEPIKGIEELTSPQTSVY